MPLYEAQQQRRAEQGAPGEPRAPGTKRQVQQIIGERHFGGADTDTHRDQLAAALVPELGKQFGPAHAAARLTLDAVGDGQRTWQVIGPTTNPFDRRYPQRMVVEEQHERGFQSLGDGRRDGRIEAELDPAPPPSGGGVGLKH